MVILVAKKIVIITIIIIKHQRCNKFFVHLQLVCGGISDHKMREMSTFQTLNFHSTLRSEDKMDKRADILLFHDRGYFAFNSIQCMCAYGLQRANHDASLCKISHVI